MVRSMTEGKPLKLILLFAVPLFIGNIFQQLYNMADSIIVGQTIGVNALAAVGATGSVVFLIVGLIQGITAGFAVITAQHFGAKDIEGVRKSIAVSLLLSVIVVAIMTVVSLCVSMPLLRLMKTPESIIEQANLYCIVIFAGTITVVFYNVFANIIRALGDSRTPLYFLIIASVINIGLDLLFIIVFKMGVEGAGLATVIAQGISAILCYFYMRKKFKEFMPKMSDFKVTISNCVRHVRVGLPMGFQYIIISIGIMFVQAAVNSFGEEKIAAFTAASKIDQLVTQILLAVGTAISTYVAQNYGAGKYTRIKKGVVAGSIVNIIFAIIGCGIILLVGKHLTALFVGDAEMGPGVIDSAQQYLTSVSLFYVVLGQIFVFRSAIQGMGNGVVPTISGAMELVARCAGSILLANAFGYVGVCLSGPLAWIAGVIVLIPAFFIIMHKLNNKIKSSNSIASE